MTGSKLTERERQERRETLEKRSLEQFNDPERVKKREWVKQVFDGDVDQIAHFAVAVMMQSGTLERENKELVEKLNRIHMVAHGLAGPNVEPHIKANIARLSAEWDPEDPVARAFLSALQTSRTLSAKANASKGHAAARKAKAFVQGEWNSHSAAYGENKSAFSRDYVRRIGNELGVRVTEKQMREVWLKATPSASRPDGLPADR